jgi:hypothetical protein
MGDVNLNGVLDVGDASLIIMYITGRAQLSPAQLSLADISGDGVINSADAMVILAKVSGLTPQDYEYDEVTLKVESQKAARGSYVNVPVVISGGANCLALEFDILYDAAVLEYDTAERFGMFNLEQVNRVEEGRIKLAYASDTALAGGGNVIVLTFKVIEECDPATEININNGKLFGIKSDFSVVNIPLKTVNGIVSAPDVYYYVISAAVGTEGGGRISGGGVFAAGEQADLIARPDEGFVFEGWYEDGVKIDGAGAGYSFIVTGDRSLEARFTKNISVTLYFIRLLKLPNKINYFVGDMLDLAGLEVTAVYSDGSSKIINNYETVPAAWSVLGTVGTEAVTVFYTEGGITKSASFDIIVEPKPVKDSVIINGIEVPIKMVNGVAVLEIDGALLLRILNAGGNEIIVDMKEFNAVDFVMSDVSAIKNYDMSFTFITSTGRFNVKTKSIWNNSGKTRVVEIRNSANLKNK